MDGAAPALTADVAAAAAAADGEGPDEDDGWMW